DASLEYGRNTTPESGLFYIGSAQARSRFAAFCREMATTSGEPAPSLRPLGAELDGLESDLLAAYRPPASIDKHREFIIASSALKAARELDAAGLRYGALLRYLQAAQRVAPLRAEAAPPDLAGLPKRLAAFEPRLSEGGVDHSIGRLYLETAQANIVSGGPPGANPAFAAAI